jgi:hypothetical protein
VALILVLVALAAVTPLALMLSDFVLTRQRQVAGLQQSLGSQAAVRGALDLAMTRLQSGEIALDPGQTVPFDLEQERRTVRVRVSRDPDAILALDGRVIDPEEAENIDPDQLVIDPVRGPVREYRKIEVYRVEAEVAARYPFAAVRLLAAVVRLDEGVISLGVRYDRGYFP